MKEIEAAEMLHKSLEDQGYQMEGGPWDTDGIFEEQCRREANHRVILLEILNDLRGELEECKAIERARAEYDELILVIDPWDGAYPTGPRP